MIDCRIVCAVASVMVLVACKADAPGKPSPQEDVAVRVSVAPPFASSASAAASSAEVPPPFASSASAVALSTDVPSGWIPVGPLTNEQKQAANGSSTAWYVFIENRMLTIDSHWHKEPTAPRLPFPLPKGMHAAQPMLPMWQVYFVTPTSDGFMVGLYGGEWGGGLYWIASDGKKHRELGNESVRGLVRVADDKMVSLEGVNHLGLGQGTARWVERKNGAWVTTATADIGAGPETFVVTPEAVLVITPKALVRVRSNHAVEVIQSLDLGGLYPNSMIADTKGRLWVGMRGYVLRLTPSGPTYTPEWFSHR